jgi:hypothetical protein
MLRPNLAGHPVPEFQSWPPWRPLVVATATELARSTGQHLIAPQTILARVYLEQIFAGLRDAGLAVLHAGLDADEEMLRQRIRGSGDAAPWRLAHLPGYRASRSWVIPAAGLVVDTARRTSLRSRTRSPARYLNYEDPQAIDRTTRGRTGRCPGS